MRVQMRSSFVHDEELASCAVREHGTCHGENAWGVCEVVLKSVLGELTLDAVIRAAAPVPAGSPPWIMNPGMTRWKIRPS